MSNSFEKQTNDLQVFNFANSGKNVSIRVQVINNEPWFIAKDVCAVLELSDVSMTISKLDEDEKLIQKVFVSGQDRDMWFINESGFYALLMRSYKPQAKPFRKWVTSEILPSIRKTGKYEAPKKDITKIELAKGIVLNIIPSDKHGFLIPTSEIARAMHISTSTLRANKSNNKLHFQRDIHFIKDYEFLDKATGITSFCTMWTKKGLIEMASHLRGGYSRLLRDWAECQIRGVVYNPGLFADQVEMKEIPVNIAHKRLTPTRMVSALALVARIEDSAIRNQLVTVLTGGANYGTI